MLALLVVKRVVRHAAQDTFPALALTWLDKTLLTPIRQSRAGGRFPNICVFLFFLPHVQRSKAELLKVLRRRDA